jgi:ribosomal protein L11 methyltransferase
MYRFYLHQGCDLDLAWEQLVSLGVDVHSSEEDGDGQKEIYGSFPQGDLTPLLALPFVKSVETVASLEIDWEAQWKTHGLNFEDGFVHLKVKDFGYKGVPLCNNLRLKPGPGFGDASHSTTKLMLHAMSSEVEGRNVLDMGCGSGILSLAAASMRASIIIGIDIQKEALLHAQENSLLNSFGGKISFCRPDELALPKKPFLILMNMIQSEQEIAWESLKRIYPSINGCITSGILQDEAEKYLQLTKKWGWTLIDTWKDSPWQAFNFKF